MLSSLLQFSRSRSINPLFKILNSTKPTMGSLGLTPSFFSSLEKPKLGNLEAMDGEKFVVKSYFYLYRKSMCSMDCLFYEWYI